jgi:hypothetical protein
MNFEPPDPGSRNLRLPLTWGHSAKAVEPPGRAPWRETFGGSPVNFIGFGQLKVELDLGLCALRQ